MATATATVVGPTMQRNDSHQEQVLDSKSNKKYPGHYKDWPNDAGFNALGDTKSKIKLTTSGTIPSYAAGRLYRTGPGGYKIKRESPQDGDFEISHWFDGFTTVHKFDLIKGGQGDQCSEVWYSSYSQVDELIEHARKTGNLRYITFAQKRDPCDTFFRKLKTVFNPMIPEGPTVNNIGVVFRETLPQELEATNEQAGKKDGRRILTLTTDANGSKQFDADTLEPIGVAHQKVLHPSLGGQISAAHAAKDPRTGEIFNFNLTLGPKPVYKVFRAGRDGKVDILAELSGNDFRPAYLHSMHLTENFVILCIWPAYFTSFGASVLWNRNILDALAFDANAETTWCVIDRHHGRGLVKKFKSPALFCFHTTNAWEEPRKDDKDAVDIVCEQMEFNNMNILHSFYYKHLVSNAPEVTAPGDHSILSLARHKLADVPLKKNATGSKSSAPQTEVILRIESPNAGELPRYNPHYVFKPHRYVWGILNRDKSSFTDGLVKTDVDTKTGVVWEQERHTPGEPIFIPAPNAKAEDEGVILSVVLDGDKGTSYLLCLDAQTMKEVGRADVPSAVGFGFHGMHVSTS